jgi:hypothetical protein
MKCSRCGVELVNQDGAVITFVLHQTTYTATLDLPCLESLIGQANSRRLRNYAFESGWKQLGLPLLNEWESRGPHRHESG